MTKCWKLIAGWHLVWGGIVSYKILQICITQFLPRININPADGNISFIQNIYVLVCKSTFLFLFFLDKSLSFRSKLNSAWLVCFPRKYPYNFACISRNTFLIRFGVFGRIGDVICEEMKMWFGKYHKHEWFYFSN